MLRERYIVPQPVLLMKEQIAWHPGGKKRWRRQLAWPDWLEEHTTCSCAGRFPRRREPCTYKVSTRLSRSSATVMACPIFMLGTRMTCTSPRATRTRERSEEHTSELQSHLNLVCRLLL